MRLLLAISIVFLSGCSALDSLIFHPVHKVWEQHQYNEASAVAPVDYQRELVEKHASDEYMRTNAISRAKRERSSEFSEAELASMADKVATIRQQRNSEGVAAQSPIEKQLGIPVRDTDLSYIDTNLVAKVVRENGTNVLGVYLGMVAIAYDGVIWPSTNVGHFVSMFSATSEELLRGITREEFQAVYVDKTQPEYPASNERK